MYCSRCGKQLDPSSRFCTSCGSTVNVAGAVPGAQPQSQMVRPRENRMIAGVCAAFAMHYGWDLNLVRIIAAVIIILTGVGALAYIAAWVIIPEAPYGMPVKSA